MLILHPPGIVGDVGVALGIDARGWSGRRRGRTTGARIGRARLEDIARVFENLQEKMWSFEDREVLGRVILREILRAD